MTSAATPPGEVPAGSAPEAGATQPPPSESDAPDEGATARRPLLRRKALWWGVAAALVVAGDAVLFSLISGWRAEAADLETRGHGIGERTSIANSLGEGQQRLIELLTAQSDAAASTLSELKASADEQETSAHAYRDVALGYQACYDARGEAIAMAWAGAPVAASLDSANAACAAADESSAALGAGG